MVKCTHIDNALDFMAWVVGCYFKWLGLSSQKCLTWSYNLHILLLGFYQPLNTAVCTRDCNVKLLTTYHN